MQAGAVLQWPALDEDADRPTARSYRTVVAAICIYLVVILLLILLFGARRVPEIPGLIPFIGAVVLTTELSTAFLLFVLFRHLRRPSVLVLACAYLFDGVTVALIMATFPGVLARDAIVWGTVQSGAWIVVSFWTGFAALGLVAMMIESIIPARLVDQASTQRSIMVGLTLTLLTVWGVAEVTTRFVDLLPPALQALPSATVCADMIADGKCPTKMAAYGGSILMFRYASVAMMLVSLGLGVMIAGRRSQMFLWFSFATACALGVNVLTLFAGARFTLGWTLGRVFWMVFASILFLLFMGQFAGQLRLLARTREFLERRVQDRTAALDASLRERDLLLREVYHRLKNNMQVVDSMLFIERRRVTEPATKEMIDLLRGRFAALGLVHQQLMASENMEEFDIAPFVHELIRNISASEGITHRDIGLTVHCEPAHVTLDFAVPFGLVVTELVTNSFKHANARQISVLFRRSDDDNALLTVEDDGIGSTETSVDHQTVTQTAGQGSVIVAGLVAQLSGRMEVTRDHGMRVDVVVPLPQRVQHT